ncbi:MAG: HAMP domain-containing protein [Haliea sp.]|nr:MAG: HAMP domain-containing protein [Haliea sp.]
MRIRVSRWMPRSLTGQLLALLLGGLVASHVIGLLLLSDNQGDIHPLARSKGTYMFARMFKAVEQLEPGLAASVLASATAPRALFQISDAPAPATPDDPSMALESKLADMLGRPESAVRACVGDHCAPGEVTREDGRPLMPMVLQAQRPDGRWVQATLWTEMRSRWWWPVSFWLQASLIPIFLAVGLAVRNVARPGRALVAAAGRVSRGERVEALKVEGPREMREIVQAFNQMQLRIARFVDDRTRMLAAISHDFRTPITSLRLRAELLEDEAVRLPMVRTLDEMRCMVDETLQFARDDAFDEPTDDVDLQGLLDEVIEDQQTLGRDVRWAAEPQALAPYRCRPLALKRAVSNLIDNAVRYGHRARVRLGTPAEHGSLHVDVEDDGPGIAPSQVEAAFKPFARLQQGTPAQRKGGSGLGLRHAKDFFSSVNGQFFIQSTVNVGTIVGGRFPREDLQS